jgi:ubiquitin-like 1-activating enzyme E1 A
MTSFVDNQRYDRQIRVWGAEAQSRIQNARILVLGFAGLNVEVTKNLVLAGMSVTIADSRKVTESDLQSNFFLSFDDIGQNIAEAVREKVNELNPNVRVVALPLNIEAVDSSLVHEYDVVLLHGESEVRTDFRIVLTGYDSYSAYGKSASGSED